MDGILNRITYVFGLLMQSFPVWCELQFYHGGPTDRRASAVPNLINVVYVWAGDAVCLEIRDLN
jgi:hypothetical protein